MSYTGSSSATTATISALYRDFLKPMTPGPMIRELLEASFDPEVQAPRLAQIIESNQLYSHYLQKLDILQEKVAQWREDFPEDRDTERLTRYIVVLLGPSAIRNAILSIWINRHAGQGLPTKPGAQVLIFPNVSVRYAMAMAEYCESNQVSNADVAYLGALCFDWVAALLEKKGGSAKAEKKYLEEIWAESMKAARIGYELAHIPEKMALSRYVMPSVLLAGLGKVLMAVSFPKPPAGGIGWKDFVKSCEQQKGRANLAYQIFERRTFAWTHADAGALTALAFSQLTPAESAIRFHLEPIVLEKADFRAFELAVIISAAMNLGKRGEAGLSSIDKSHLVKIGISESALKAAVSKLREKSKGAAKEPK